MQIDYICLNKWALVRLTIKVSGGCLSLSDSRSVEARLTLSMHVTLTMVLR